MLLLRGLGASSVNTGVIKQTGTIPGRGTVPPSPGVESSHTAQYFTVASVGEFYRNYLWNEYEPANAAWRVATAAALPPCPASAVSADGLYCYTGNIVDPAMMAPGTISVFGVPFHITEMNQYGQFNRVFRPDRVQRVQIEKEVVDRSVALLSEAISKKQLLGSFSGTRFTDPKYSWDQAFARLGGGFTLKLDNFGFNSIWPTPAERTNANGFKSWLERGGFLISNDVVGGKVYLFKNLALSFCKSSLCSCNGKAPSCIQGWITKNGEFRVDPKTGTSEDSAAWNVYVKIYPTGGTFEIATINQDGPAFYERWAAKAGSLLVDIGLGFCASNPTEAAGSDKICLDKAGKTCKEGTTGCTCKPLPGVTQGVKDGWRGITAKLCADAQKEYLTPPKTWEPPPDKFTGGNDLPITFKVPWWAVVAGGLVVGAAVFSRRG